MDNKTQYEMIICIVNAGYSGLVMEVAKNEGAGGGTVIRARGTANKEAELFFHITVQPDKDVVMILVPVEIRDAVLHAIYKGAGLGTDGHGIAFSVPVCDTVGLKEPKKAEKQEN